MDNGDDLGQGNGSRDRKKGKNLKLTSEMICDGNIFKGENKEFSFDHGEF